MENMKKKLGIFGFVFLMLIAGSAFVNAGADTGELYYGKSYIGGTASPLGSIITAYTGAGELVGNTTVNDATLGNYTMFINVTNETSSTDGYAKNGENLTFKINGVTAYTPAPQSEVVTHTGGQTPPQTPGDHPNVDINTTPSCTDGVKNGNETLTDCSMTANCSCTPCYNLSVSPTSDDETFTAVNTSQTFVLTIQNTGYHNLTGINLVVPTCNFTVEDNVTTFDLHGSLNGSSTDGHTITVFINKTMGDLIEGTTYYCNITVNSTNVTKLVPLTITYSTATTTTLVRRRYFEMSYTPEQPKTGSCVTLKITDRSTGDGVKEADVDIYLDGVKLFYGITDSDGVFGSFCPTKTGTYEVKLDKTRYKEYTDTITVGAGTATTTAVPVVTTAKPVVTTPEEPEVTTEAPVVTTPEEPEVTTEAPVVTTEAPVVTTTVPPAAGGMDQITLLMIVIVIVIILAVLYLVTKKKKETGGKKKSKEE